MIAEFRRYSAYPGGLRPNIRSIDDNIFTMSSEGEFFFLNIFFITFYILVYL